MFSSPSTPTSAASPDVFSGTPDADEWLVPMPKTPRTADAKRTKSPLSLHKPSTTVADDFFTSTMSLLDVELPDFEDPLDLQVESLRDPSPHKSPMRSKTAAAAPSSFSSYAAAAASPPAKTPAKKATEEWVPFESPLGREKEVFFGPVGSQLELEAIARVAVFEARQAASSAIAAIPTAPAPKVTKPVAAVQASKMRLPTHSKSVFGTATTTPGKAQAPSKPAATVTPGKLVSAVTPAESTAPALVKVVTPGTGRVGPAQPAPKAFPQAVPVARPVAKIPQPTVSRLPTFSSKPSTASVKKSTNDENKKPAMTTIPAKKPVVNSIQPPRQVSAIKSPTPAATSFSSYNLDGISEDAYTSPPPPSRPKIMNTPDKKALEAKKIKSAWSPIRKQRDPDEYYYST